MSPVTIISDEYRMTVYAGNRPVATAIRTQWGWHVPLASKRSLAHGGNRRIRWSSWDHRSTLESVMRATAEAMEMSS